MYFLDSNIILGRKRVYSLMFNASSMRDVELEFRQVWEPVQEFTRRIYDAQYPSKTIVVGKNWELGAL